MAWTTDELVARARRQAYLPDAGGPTSAEILEVAEEELLTLLAGLVKSARGGRGLVRSDISLLTSSARYRLPRRCLAGTIESVSLVDPSGEEVPAVEVPPSELFRWASLALPARACRFALEDEDLVLPGPPTTAGYSLRVRHMRRPSRLILTAAAAAIASAGSTTTLTLVVSPTPPASVTNGGAIVDVVRGDPPFDVTIEDCIVDGWASPTLTLASPFDLAKIAVSTIGNERVDYVCPRDTTVYPQVPVELFPALVSATAKRVMKMIGDRAGAMDAAEDAAAHAAAARDLLDPRSRRPPKVVTRSGPLRGRGRASGWGR